MRIEELFVGAYVKLPELEYYYDEEDFGTGFSKVKALSRYELDTDSLSEIGYDRVTGIELTEDILLSLGFKKDGYCNMSPDYVFENDLMSISINLEERVMRSTGIWITNKKTKNTVSLEIPRASQLIEDRSKRTLYVHQLQKLLILSDLEFSIEL